ncbi:MAG: sulfurtransferase TusA family protein [Eubacteriales bacterium]|nr:sulfurtransferase TusA family protein [Eubacteriales bacterium]
MKHIDAIGLSCPQPVLLCKKALAASPEGIEIEVDNTTACGNVTRFAENLGYKVTVKEADGTYLLAIAKA